MSFSGCASKSVLLPTDVANCALLIYTLVRIQFTKMKLLVIAFCIVALSLGLFSELGGGVPTLISNRRGQEKINPNRNTVDLTCREDGSDIPSTFWNGTTRLNSMVSATHTHVLTPDTEAGLSCRNEAGVPSNERRLAG